RADHQMFLEHSLVGPIGKPGRFASVRGRGPPPLVGRILPLTVRGLVDSSAGARLTSRGGVPPLCAREVPPGKRTETGPTTSSPPPPAPGRRRRRVPCGEPPGPAATERAGGGEFGTTAQWTQVVRRLPKRAPEASRAPAAPLAQEGQGEALARARLAAASLLKKLGVQCASRGGSGPIGIGLGQDPQGYSNQWLENGPRTPTSRQAFLV
ncbi:unnamed protein product, partial [Prorocentrum cordatum]